MPFAIQHSRPHPEQRISPRSLRGSRRHLTRTALVLHPTVQTKLRVGAPNDSYEQQADRVAEQVTRMPEPTEDFAVGLTASPESVQRKCAACGSVGICAHCEEEIRRKSENDGPQILAASTDSTPLRRQCAACAKQ